MQTALLTGVLPVALATKMPTSQDGNTISKISKASALYVLCAYHLHAALI